MGKLAVKVFKNVFAKGREAMENGDDYGNVELEPGRYHGVVKGARAVEINGTPKLIIDVQVPEAGGKVALWYTLDEEKIVWLLRDVKKLGYDPESIDSPEALADLIDTLKDEQPAVKISAKRGGEYVNTRLDGVLTGAVADEVKEAASGEATEKEEEAEEKPAKKIAKKPAKAEEAEEEEEAEAEEEAEEEAKEEEEEKHAKTTKKPVGGKTTKKKDDEEETEEEAPDAEEANEEELEIGVGTKCKADINGEVQPVEITELDEENEKVKVKTKKGKVFKVGFSKLSV